MAYSDFSLDELKSTFHLSIAEDIDLFRDIAPVEISDIFLQFLEENVPLALAIDTQKARSEFIIAPILAEYRKILKHQISLFSGIDFTVDSQKGLNGVCDFIISKSPEQFYVSAPIIVLVEAKNDRIKTGIPQCLSEMIAAKIFNEQHGNPFHTIYGGVSTGSLWRFLKLKDHKGFIDQEEYHVKTIQKILGILIAMSEQKA